MSFHKAITKSSYSALAQVCIPTLLLLLSSLVLLLLLLLLLLLYSIFASFTASNLNCDFSGGVLRGANQKRNNK